MRDLTQKDEDALKRRSIAALGRFRSGVTDLGSAHDDHLGRVFEDR